jgi:saccharopine dehydrogenase (NAD+, L-lysine-forming)
MAETKNGGPFEELLQEVDILINCVYLTTKIPPFIDEDSLKRAGPGRRLRIVCDISCDYTSANHPLPFFAVGTDLHHPVLELPYEPPVDVIAIDHLPSLLPKESSQAFSHDLLPTLSVIADLPTPSVWQRSLDTFQRHRDRAIAATSSAL